MSVNKVILIGRLGKDPELKYTESGKPVCNFSIATSSKWTKDGQDNEATTWHNIVAWGKQAEVLKEYLRKGKEVYIEGRIDNGKYKDGEGKDRYYSQVVLQSFQFVGSRGDAAEKPVDRPNKNGDENLPF